MSAKHGRGQLVRRLFYHLKKRRPVHCEAEGRAFISRKGGGEKGSSQSIKRISGNDEEVGILSGREEASLS